MIGWYIQKNRSYVPEEAMKCPELIKSRKVSEAEISRATDQLETLRPRLGVTDCIQKVAGC